MTWVTLTKKSKNRKVGEIAVSTSDKDTCPESCSLKDEDCYARFGPLGIHWGKIGPGQRGDNWTGFCKRLLTLPIGSMFRHNQAGDLPKNKNETINFRKIKQLVRAIVMRSLKAWTYTHFDPTIKHNADAIEYCNKNGFTVNMSADSLADADKYYNLGIGPVTVVLPNDSPTKKLRTPGNLPIVVCPAQTNEAMNCQACKLCSVANRKSIVGFLAHGTAKKRLTKRLTTEK